jgi:hypothetical protein
MYPIMTSPQTSHMSVIQLGPAAQVASFVSAHLAHAPVQARTSILHRLSLLGSAGSEGFLNLIKKKKKTKYY